jgi:RNA-binding protein YhbY
MSMALTGKQRRALRALGHHLQPVLLYKANPDEPRIRI